MFGILKFVLKLLGWLVALSLVWVVAYRWVNPPTTSLMIPLAGGGVFNTRQLYPFTLGANIGTTITALLAATAISGAGAQLALTIALVHVLFNLFAVVLIYGVPFLRELFHFSRLHAGDLLLCLGAGVASIGWFEVLKIAMARRRVAR